MRVREAVSSRMSPADVTEERTLEMVVERRKVEVALRRRLNPRRVAHMIEFTPVNPPPDVGH